MNCLELGDQVDPLVVESTADPLELKIAFIVDPAKAAQAAQLELVTGILLKKYCVGVPGEEGEQPEKTPLKSGPLGCGAIPKGCGRSNGPPRGCGRSSGPPMSHREGGVSTRSRRGC